MCGITGILRAGPLEGSDNEALTTMMDAIHHRGPDGQGRHVVPEQGLAMGHTRLSINDLETGEQPLASVDEQLTLTVNGEFYDFKKHRSLAMAEGDRFSCKSDSEIALTLYRKYGLGFMDHLRGEFAFALYDRKEETLILARDRFGIRPLFFHLEEDTLIYGSEVKTILAHPSVKAELDPKAALNQLMQVMVPGTSAFKGIHAIPPGHFMVIKRRKGRLETNTHRYWDLDFPEQADRPSNPDAQEHIQLIRERLIESIVFRLEADVPVGCYLSGGIDSCCILGLATGAMQSPVKAFTISFDHDSYDESHIAREMAESMEADQETIHLKAADLYGKNYLDTVRYTERTFYNTLGVAKMLMSRRVRECGYKTVITGEGSDELFGGYAAFKRDYFLHGLSDPTERAKQEALLAKSNKLVTGAILAENQEHHEAWEDLCGFTPSWLQPWIATLKLARPLLSDDLQDLLREYDPIAAIAEQIDPAMLRGRHALDKAQYTWTKCQLEGQILNWGGDRVDMANSMESRPAFLDHHVAEAATQVPPEFRIHGNIEKWVLREAVRGVLPEVLYKREKFAFMAPPAHTDKEKQSAVDQLIKAHLNADAIKAAGVVDAGRVSAFLDAYRNDEDAVSLTRKDTLLNHLLTLHMVHQHFAA
jgi:asparagine synthase (glutamine-hydrolysing)